MNDELELQDAEQSAAEELTELTNIAGDILEKQDDATLGECRATAVEDVVGELVESYSTSNYTEEARAIYRMGLEATFQNIGVRVNADAFLKKDGQISLESAEQKGDGILAKIWEWLKSVYQGLADSVTAFINQYRVSLSGLRKQLEKAKEVVKDVEGTATQATFSAPAIANYLCDRNGKAQDPYHHITEVVSTFQHFAKEIDGTFHELNNVDPSSLMQKFMGLKSFVDNIQSSGPEVLGRGIDHLHNLYFVPQGKLVLTKGSNPRYPVIGASIRAEMVPASSPDLPTLTANQMNDAIRVADRAISVLKDIDADLNTIVRTAKRVSSATNTLRPGTPDPQQREQARQFISAIASSSKLHARAWIIAFPYALLNVQASLRYITRSAAQY